MTDTIYRCPPLRAWLSEKQCAYHRALADRARGKPRHSDEAYRAMFVLDSCMDCPGVRALGAGVRNVPEVKSKREPAVRPRRRRPTMCNRCGNEMPYGWDFVMHQRWCRGEEAVETTCA